MPYIEALKQYFLEDNLPGPDAQFKMAHGSRPQNQRDFSGYKQAGTLLLIYPKQGEWYFVLQKRTSKYKGDKHAGQISLPGGKHELTDDSLEHTALRETQEEMGIDQNQINLLGALTPLSIPVSKFRVFPFVGLLERAPQFVLEKDEVEDILEIPVKHILDPIHKRETNIKVTEHLTLNRVPFYDFESNIIWGATAMMLSEFESILKEIQA